jgi:hypothetical protein
MPHGLWQFGRQRAIAREPTVLMDKMAVFVEPP